MLKTLFKFLFVEELAQLESCKNELEEARVNYNKLLNDYNTLAKSYNENVGKVCGCRIGNMYYIIEPQNDRIVFETRLD